MIDLLKLV